MPKKSLGQNFLIDKNIIKKIINNIFLGKTERIVEIGPGQGALTKEIIKDFDFESFKSIEIDSNLVNNPS